ncbi:phage minor tail protein L [Moraxella sp. VT-16-12]|uniref:phage minor tail protein L n=1 Tax=Moraxella sp. VT-16-12 TaxID=2014877 RepID=UPI000B7D090C|nr:phage minor tail protein L [Moraxella sp. VT-16-12]TWV81507.1 phage minor tail protein L [Moraxella sp. VT-16-12]
MSFNSNIQQSSVQGFITLYELDARKLGGDVYRFHGHAHSDNDGKIIWQGQEFIPIAITAEGLEVRGDGKASMPTITIHNDIGGVPQALRLLCLRFGDFAGARLTVIHTLAEYLDNPNSQADEQNYRTSLWYIEQKTNESSINATTTFELANPTDFEGRKLPFRQITSFCHWAVCGKYRGEECNYTDTKRFTIDGKPTDDPEQDKCSGRLFECKLRGNEQRFGGFPASSLIGS